MSDTPKAIVLAYHEAFYRNDRADIRAVVAEGNDVLCCLRIKNESAVDANHSSRLLVQDGKRQDRAFSRSLRPHTFCQSKGEWRDREDAAAVGRERLKPKCGLFDSMSMMQARASDSTRSFCRERSAIFRMARNRCGGV